MSGEYILLVEDDVAVSQMYQRKLEAAGYEVKLAQDGEAGWQELETGKRPDLVLLDILLPKKDGFEILRDIRKSSELLDLKVMMLTNLGQRVDKEEAYRLGADKYVVKALITPKELLIKIENMLNEKERAL